MIKWVLLTYGLLIRTLIEIKEVTVYVLLGFVVCILLNFAVVSQTPPQWNIVTPSNTGIPGDEVRLMALDPQGNLWVAGRQVFRGEVGLTMLTSDQLVYEPLPGGGFDTGAWRVWSSLDNPIPSVYLHDMAFSADGTVWLASDAGLTRFRPYAKNPQEMWHTFTPSNSPLLIDRVTSIAVDRNGQVWVSNADLNLTSGGLFKLDPTINSWTQVIIQQPGGSAQRPWDVIIGNDNRVLVSMTTSPGFAEFNGSNWVIHNGGVLTMDNLLQDSAGNVWAASIENGLWKWNGSSWQNWAILGGEPTITGLGTDRNGVVYVSCWNGPIYKMIGDTPILFADAQHLPRSVIGLANGDIYVNNYGSTSMLGTVRHYDSSGQLLERFNTFNTGLQDYFVDRINSDSSGNLWFATGEGGLTRMFGNRLTPVSSTHFRNWGNHNNQSEPYPWFGSEPMYSILEDSDGIYWFGGNGVGRWNSQTGQFTGFWNSQNSNLDTSGVTTITKRSGTVWIGTNGSGIYRFDATNESWHQLILDGGHQGANNVRAMSADNQNNLWVASEYGLRRFAAGDDSNYTLFLDSNSPLPGNSIYDLEPDLNGGVWVGTDHGLARFNGSSWTIFNRGNTGMPGEIVYDISRRRSDGLIAIASNQPSIFPYTGGVSTFGGNTWTHYTTENSPLTHWQVVAAEFDIRGNLWASPMSKGVVQIQIGNSPNLSAPADFDGDGFTDLSIFRPSTAEWWYSQSSDGQVRAIQFGNGSDKVIPGDFTGDGKADIAVFRPVTGDWFVLRSENNSYFGLPFGTDGDIPVSGDFDGDGRTDAAIFRPVSGNWYILRSSDRQVQITHFGVAGDRPVAGDYDGDGKTDIAIFRSTGSTGAEWWVLRSSKGLAALQFGLDSDVPVPGDYTGDGNIDIAVWRPASGTWFILRSEDNSYFAFPFGIPSDIPAPGDYDGDGKFDAAVFRPTEGTWFINLSSSGVRIQGFGMNGDLPVPSGFVK